ncbi:MAG: hypothetical protein QM758_09370 [Armatimonas sp.]
MSHAVPSGEGAYLRQSVFPAMPSSEDRVSEWPALSGNMGAHWSYVLDDGVVYWCVEWEPGLVAV